MSRSSFRKLASLGAIALLAGCGGEPTSSTHTTAVPGQMVIAAVAPAAGPSNGWTPVIIKGSGLRQVAKVTFGSAEGVQLRVTDDATISVLAPPHAAGQVMIVATDARGVAGIGRLPFLYSPPESTACAGCWDY